MWSDIQYSSKVMSDEEGKSKAELFLFRERWLGFQCDIVSCAQLIPSPSTLLFFFSGSIILKKLENEF